MGSTNVTKEVVELTAIDNATRVIQGVGNAAQQLGKTYDGLIGKMGALGLAVAGVGSVAGFAAMIKGSIEAEAALLRLSERTGNTVEALSSVMKVAKMSGTDMDEVGKGMQKLAKAMAESEDGTSKAAKVFKALDISVRDASTGAFKPTQVVMQELGQKLMAMKDQTLAVAFAQAVLGKAGANLLPFLYELARAGELQSKVTTEQAKTAKEFEDNLVRLNSASTNFFRHLANDMLPTLVKYSAQLLAAREASGGFFGGMFAFATTSGADAANPAAALDGIQAKLEKLYKTRDEFAGMGSLKKFFSADDIAIVNTQIATMETRQKMLQRLAFSQIQDHAGGTPQPGVDIPNSLGKPDKASKALSPFDTEWNKLIGQLRTGEGEGSVAASVMHAADAGDFGKITDQQRKQLINLAAQVEYRKQSNALEKENEEVGKHVAGIMEQQEKAVQAQTLHWQEVADPTMKYRLELEQINSLLESGRLTQDQWVKAAGSVMKANEDNLTAIQNKLDNSDKLADKFGLTLASAAGKAVTDFSKLRDVLKGLALDIGQLVLKATVLDPLQKGITSGLKDFNWGSLLDFGGGKASGGDVMGGTSYLVGENGPEMFTPGPGGGSITPNGALGGDTYYIDATGADPAAIARLEARIRATNGSIERRSVSAVRRAFNSRGVATSLG